MSAGDRRWAYPHFHSIAGSIIEHINETKSSVPPGQARSSIKPRENAHVYILEEGFLPQDRNWIRYVEDSRMTRVSKVLYRPKIVRKLLEKIEFILASRFTRGLLVKGPQGVGKSYSLINLTRFLMASNEYWVTIIPDCECWDNERDFFEFLLQSVGVDPIRTGLDYDATIDPDFKKLIHDIDTVLTEHGMKWVFIFDQINRIFTRPECHFARDVGMLPAPFKIMKKILNPGRIISIISASANNDLSHRENHKGFDEFEHPTQFEKDEIESLYTEREIASWTWKELEYATGQVPLYLSRWAKDPKRYSDQVLDEIKGALGTLKTEEEKRGNWQAFVHSAIHCVLKEPLARSPRDLDRKFSQAKGTPGGHNIHVVALFPLVEQEYRDYFWDQITAYVTENEANLLRICNDAGTAPDVRGRLLEQMMIRRIVQLQPSIADFTKIFADAKIDMDDYEFLKAALQGPVDVSRIQGHIFPDCNSLLKDRKYYFIPMAHNFPAVDLIISLGGIVIAFQFHVSREHSDALKTLKTRVKTKWNTQQVRKIILVYLSPKDETTIAMKQQISGKKALGASRYVTLFYSIQDFDRLKDLQWNC